MKRVLLLTLVLATVVILGVIPYWFGVEAERIYQRQISSLGANRNVSIVENSFERGWLRSSAESKVAMTGTPVIIAARHNIEHGPIPVSAPLRYIVSLRPMQALIRSSITVHRAQPAGGDLATGTLLTRVNIDGTTRTQIEIPPVQSISLDPPQTVSWQQISGHVDFDPARGAWQGAINLGGTEWRDGDAVVKIGPSDLKFLTYPGSNGLAMGSSTLATESVEGLLPQSQARIIARNLAVDSTASEQDRKVKYTLGGTLGSADIVDLKIDSGDWSVMVEDLDLDALGKLNTREVGAAIPLNELMAVVSRHQAKFESSLKVATHSGPFTASAIMRLTDSTGSTNPLVLLSTLVGSLDLDMPRTVVEVIAQSVLYTELNKDSASSAGGSGIAVDDAVSDKIQSWVNGNILTRHGDRYRFRATINNGAIELNGRPFNLMSLLR